MLNGQDTQRPHEHRRGGYAARGPMGVPHCGRASTGGFRSITCSGSQPVYMSYLNHWLHCGQFFPLLRQNNHHCWRHFWLAQLRGVHFVCVGGSSTGIKCMEPRDATELPTIHRLAPWQRIFQVIHHLFCDRCSVAKKILLIGIKPIVRLLSSQSWEEINSLCTILGKCKIELGSRWSEL